MTLSSTVWYVCVFYVLLLSALQSGMIFETKAGGLLEPEVQDKPG
uniref:Uncharacterized protein n=1 Tax=Callithrix jacchus TaxID=9483 RepID=A0A5F4VSV5_CALJA